MELSLGTLLTVAFVVLKLCDVIHWSWVWVLAPLWMSIALALIFLALGGFVFAMVRRR